MSMPRMLALSLCILFFGGLFIAACGDSEPVVRVDMSKREEIAFTPEKKVLTYAYLPQYSHEVSYRRHHRIVDFLEQHTGHKFRQVFPATFDEHVKMVERGEIDISFSNPFTYIQIAKSGARAFARIVEPDGRPYFRGQIIARADNPAVKTVSDCRGKSWIAVDPYSAGGYLYALGLFHDLGLSRDDFAELAFAPGPGGKQEKVVLAVFAGKYDIGSIREGTLDVVGDKVDLKQVRVLAQTRTYPSWVYAARKGLDPKIVQQIRGALLSLDMEVPPQALILKTAGMLGVIPADDADYDPVRELAAKLGLF